MTTIPIPTARRASRDLSPADGLGLARAYIADHYAHPAGRTVHWHAGGWQEWDGTRYREVTPEEIQGPAWAWLEAQGLTPSRRVVAELMAALQAIACLPSALGAPGWIGDPDHPAAGLPPGEVVAVDGGLLDLRTRDLHPATPGYYTHHALGTPYDPAAPAPARWLRHLDEMYDGDTETIEAIQEYTGYLVSGDTAHQKALLMVSPRRGGKGTVLRIIRALLGAETVAGPTLTSLAGPFGLEPLVHRSVAIIGDARISARAEWSIIAERILSVTGEDTVTVDRKFRPSWTGRLPTRFVLATNELPRLADASSALVGRFVVAMSERSWYGREDPGLLGRLLPELSGILGWALDGLDRLRTRGHFRQPARSADAIRTLEDLGSPVAAFIRAECEIDPAASALKAHVYERWREWCHDHGYPRPTSEAAFGRDLRAALPSIRSARPRDDGDRVYAWTGLRLRPRGAE